MAQMFVNNASRQRGLVCQYDVVCFDEISGISFDFSRGKESGCMVWGRPLRYDATIIQQEQHVSNFQLQQGDSYVSGRSYP